MQCRVCGAENEAGATFCYRCGSSLTGQAATGATVNLGQTGAPPSSKRATADLSGGADSGARVYDAAPEHESGGRVYDAPAPGSADRLGQPPEFQPPVYQVPPQAGAAYSVPYGTQTMPQQSNSALWSMLLGTGSLILFTVLLCFFFLSPISLVLGIPAVVLGRNARREILASGGQLTGDGMARAGVIMGWINIGLSILTICGIVAFFALLAVGITSS
jgi:hypothetical protein